MKNKSRTANSLINISFTILNQIVTLILSFISRYIFIKVLGTNYLGINGLFTDILMVLSLADLGLGSAMVYSYYKPLAENDKTKLAALINFYKKIYIYISVLVGLIGLLITPFLKYIVNLDTPIDNLELYYILFLANTVVSYLFIYKSSIINADQKGYIISFYATIANILRITVQTIVLVVIKNYVLFLLIQILTTLLNNIWVAKKADKLYPFINDKYSLNKNEKIEIFNKVKSVFVYKLSSILLNGTDNMIISSFIGTIYVGLYSNYNLIIGTISRFITLGFSSINSSVGNLITENDIDKRYFVFKVMQMISFILSGISFVCLYNLINDFIILWIGESFIFNKFTIIFILINFYLSTVLPPIWSFREATGLFEKTKYIMLITAIVNLVLSVTLAKWFGVGGVILASAIARITTYFWYEPIILFRDYFNRSAITYFLNQFKNAIVVIILTIITDLVFTNIIIDSWIDIFIKGFVCLVIVSTSYFAVFYKTEEFKYILSKINIKRVTCIK